MGILDDLLHHFLKNLSPYLLLQEAENYHWVPSVEKRNYQESAVKQAFGELKVVTILVLVIYLMPFSNYRFGPTIFIKLEST